MAESNLSMEPKEIYFDGRMHIIWQDDVHTIYNYWDLRTACPCAVCVDEITGEKILDDSTIPQDIHPLKYARVGNYAVEILWSDDHDTGIFTYEKLRDGYPHSTAMKF